MDLTIRTDRKWKDLQYRWDVPAKVLADQFDYQDTSEESGVTDGFFCYLGTWYHLDQFTRMESSDVLAEWDGYAGDSYFSGVLIKLSEDGEQYQVGRYYS